MVPAHTQLVVPTIPVVQLVEDLWDEAYTNLKDSKEHGELLLQYERLFLYTEGAPPPQMDRQQVLKGFIVKKIAAVKAVRWTFRLDSRTFAVREIYNKVVHTVAYAADFIGSVASNEPHAALAWAGVSLLLPVR